MEGADENPEKFNLSLNTTTNSRDLLKRFRHQTQDSSEQDNDDELELSLGLSLNGIFGVDPTNKKLKRSSSIANLPFTVVVGSGAGAEGSSRGDVAAEEFEGHALPIFRTSSLPIQGQGQGKELVSMKQMEARKKRMEKLKNVRLVNKDKENGGGGGAAAADFNTNPDNDDNKKNGLQVHEGAVGVQNLDAEVLDGLPSSQGSIGSQGSGASSGFSDHQSQQIEEVRQTTEVKTSSGHQALQSQVEQKPAPGAGAGAGAVIMDADAANKLFKMPYVSLKGSGGNGRKTEGFLYRYNKGEEVKIVCVCHGLFLSPAEFVKHGGGGDVEYPLKHIVVNPSPLF